MKKRLKEMQNFFKVMVMAISACIMCQCSGESADSKQNDNILIPAVEAVQARYGTLPLSERLTGLVRAKNLIEVYPEISAVVVAVNVENGDYVKRGEPLLELRDIEFSERLKQATASYQIALAQERQAQARLEEMQADLNRIQSLAEKGLASPAELENIRTETVSAEADVALANARVSQAQATMDERKETLSQTVIRSPITGRVGNRNAEVGMLVNSNTRLFILGQLDSVRVGVILTDRMLNYIEKGQRTAIYLENAPLGTISAPLSRISPFLHPVTHSTEAQIDLPNPSGQLMSGMFVTVDIFYGESEQATLVPLSSLYENPVSGETGVYISKESLNKEPVSTADARTGAGLSDPVTIIFVPVDIIAKGRMEAGIRGVESGDWVVTIGQDLIAGDSSRARVRKVDWAWVEHLQQLQRQDLLQEIMMKQQSATEDTMAVKFRTSQGE
jgi:RND family efflux transporter MFP subunit